MPVALANSSACDSRMISHRCRAPFHHIVLRRRRNNRPRFQAGAICRCPLMRKYGIVRLPRPLGMCDRFLLGGVQESYKNRTVEKTRIVGTCQLRQALLSGLLTVRRALPSRPSHCSASASFAASSRFDERFPRGLLAHKDTQHRTRCTHSSPCNTFLSVFACCFFCVLRRLKRHIMCAGLLARTQNGNFMWGEIGVWQRLEFHEHF